MSRRAQLVLLGGALLLAILAANGAIEAEEEPRFVPIEDAPR